MSEINLIDSVPGKILYMIYKMHQESVITLREKFILKGQNFVRLDLVVSDQQCLRNAYEDYLHSGT